MKIGLYDLDGHNFPNLALMKISAYHKSKGDAVEFCFPLETYDRVYVSSVFGDEYVKNKTIYCNAKEVVYGGTGFAIKVENGREIYYKNLDNDLPIEIEHIYPDYSIYPELTKNTAYGFLTRGCPNNCGFCIVSKKEGLKARKVADLAEFWNGQKYIKLLDANLLACRDRVELLQQLRNSGAKIDFTQGLDARLMTDEIAKLLNEINKERVHFAFDFMKNEKQILRGLEIYAKHCKVTEKSTVVYILTNYNTTIDEDLYRIREVQKRGYAPDVRIYRKPTAPKILKDLQRWCNNRILYHSCDFMDYVPRKDGQTIRQLYFGG